jgi:Xaa-Pro aminopeptidase
VFDSQVYIDRRRKLQNHLGNGLVLFPGNGNSSINYEDNHYPFRQDSNFLYYFGLDKPGLIGVIDIDNDTEALFGNDLELNNIIWEGNQPSLSEWASKTGVTTSYPLKHFNQIIQKAVATQQRIHFLPPYRPENEKKFRDWLNFPNSALQEHASVELIKAFVSQRSYKSQEEIAEIEKAIDVAVAMHMEVMCAA